ncbi:MAG: oligosaccharide flippase family protein [Acidimicrobiales bacterium]
MVEPSAGTGAARSLTAARVLEQAALAATLIVLARRLSVASFGEASLAVAFQAVAITASDFGVGLALLRLPGRAPVDQRSRRRAQRINRWVLAGTALVTALAAPVIGRPAVVVVVAGAMWWSSALAYIAKAATLRARHPGRVASAEITSSIVFLALAVAVVGDDLPFVTLGGAYVVRNLVEAGALRSWSTAAFSPSGALLHSRWVWVTQVTSYVTANIDYLVVGLALGPVDLGIYSLAYRAANLLPSQVSFVVGRVAILTLADQAGADRWTAARSLVVRLFVLGSAASLLALVVAPVVPDLLGEQWEPSVDVILVLLVGVPWRLVLPVAGLLALVEDKARALVRWEVARLALTAVALAVGSLGGVTGVAIAATVVTIVATFVYDAAIGPRPSIARSGIVGPAAIASCVALGTVAALAG